MVKAWNASSLSVTARVNVRALGTALRYMEGQGIRPRSRSEIVALCVDAVAGCVGKEEEWLSLDQAIFELDSRFPVQTRKGVHLITKQSTEKRRDAIRQSEEAWLREQGRNGGQANFGESQLGGSNGMVMRGGRMYLVVANREEIEGAQARYGGLVQGGALTILTKEEWEELGDE